MNAGFLYNRVMEYEIRKKALFSKQCPADKKPIFHTIFELEEGQEKPEKETGVEAVKGKAKLNGDILRCLEEQKKDSLNEKRKKE
jgi:hypothetical protein